jgi:hypothetical protein
MRSRGPIRDVSSGHRLSIQCLGESASRETGRALPGFIGAARRRSDGRGIRRKRSGLIAGNHNEADPVAFDLLSVLLATPMSSFAMLGCGGRVLCRRWLVRPRSQTGLLQVRRFPGRSAGLPAVRRLSKSWFSGMTQDFRFAAKPRSSARGCDPLIVRPSSRAIPSRPPDRLGLRRSGGTPSEAHKPAPRYSI